WFRRQAQLLLRVLAEIEALRVDGDVRAGLAVVGRLLRGAPVDDAHVLLPGVVAGGEATLLLAGVAAAAETHAEGALLHRERVEVRARTLELAGDHVEVVPLLRNGVERRRARTAAGLPDPGAGVVAEVLGVAELGQAEGVLVLVAAAAGRAERVVVA